MARYFNSNFDDYDEEFLEHYGIKGMKWKNHVYAKLDDFRKKIGKKAKGITNAAIDNAKNTKVSAVYANDFRKAVGKRAKKITNAAIDNAKNTKVTGKYISDAYKGGRKYVKNKVKNVGDYYNKKETANKTQYELSKKLEKKKAVKRASQIGRPDVSNEIYRKNVKKLKSRRNKHTLDNIRDTVNYAVNSTAKDYKNKKAKRIQDKKDYVKMMQTKKIRDKINKKRLRGMNLSDYNKYKKYVERS